MSEAGTSKAAYGETVASGDDAESRQEIIAALVARGPLTTFELEDALLADFVPRPRSAITARIDELQKLRIVGTMSEVRVNPRTNKECLVYGLIVQHKAKPRYEQDRIEVKINEQRYYRKFDYGAVAAMNATDIAMVVGELVLEAAGA